MTRPWTVVRRKPGRVVRRGGRLLPGGAGWFWLATPSERLCFTFAPFRGIHLCWRGREYWGDFPRPGTSGLREVPDVKKKSATSGGGDERHLAAIETEVFRDHLAIVEHLAVTRYDDGDARQPGWLTIRTQGRSWVADVKDPDSACSFRVLATTLDELLETVQELLSTEDAPWEKDKYLQQSKTQKSKK